MSEKRVKAWAVVDAVGDLVPFMEGSIEVFTWPSKAEIASGYNPERVVPVTIVWEES